MSKRIDGCKTFINGWCWPLPCEAARSVLLIKGLEVERSLSTIHVDAVAEKSSEIQPTRLESSTQSIYGWC